MEDRRLVAYVEAAQRLSEGRLPVEIPVLGNDEVALLGQALQSLAKAMEKRIEEASLLRVVTQKVNRGVVLDEVLTYVFESFRPILPYDRIGFALLVDSGKKVQARWARTSAPEVRLPIGFTAPLSGSSLKQILDTGRPRILNDLEDYLRQHPQSESTRLIVAEGMRSSLTCPLVAMGKPIGFLFFSSRERETYRDVHVDTFLQIAEQLSIIVEKSRLYEQLLAEQARSERLLLNVIPQPIVQRRKETEQVIADRFDSVSVLFADIVGFTELATKMSPESLVSLLNSIFGAFDEVVAQWGWRRSRPSEMPTWRRPGFRSRARTTRCRWPRRRSTCFR
jgi:GAF domain-containing protein